MIGEENVKLCSEEAATCEILRGHVARRYECASVRRLRKTLKNFSKRFREAGSQ